MPVELGRRLRRGQIPQPDGAVAATRCQPHGAIFAAYGHKRPYWSFMTHERASLDPARRIPQPDLSVDARRREQDTVLMSRDGREIIDDAIVPKLERQRFPRKTPQPDLSVNASGGEPHRAIGGWKGHDRPDQVRVALPRSQLASALQVPEADGPVAITRSKPFDAVGCRDHAHRVDGVDVTLKGMQLTPGGYVPQVDDAVHIG
jgi:hypothetical protein